MGYSVLENPSRKRLGYLNAGRQGIVLSRFAVSVLPFGMALGLILALAAAASAQQSGIRLTQVQASPPPVQPATPRGPGGIETIMAPPPAEDLLAPKAPGSDALPPGLKGYATPIVPLPRPNEETQRLYDRFIQGKIDPTNTLEMLVSRPRVLVLKQVPKRVQIGDDRIATYQLLDEHEISVMGARRGAPSLTSGFRTRTIRPANWCSATWSSCWPIRRSGCSGARTIYKQLAADINRNFPDSHVDLSLVGNQVVLRGEAKDAIESAQILMVVQAVAMRQQNQQQQTQVNNLNLLVSPDQLNQQSALEQSESLEQRVPLSDQIQGRSMVINLLRIPGEQQVMLKVTVAEVNRTAARSIGMNFNIANAAGSTVFSNFTGGLISQMTTSVVATTTGTSSTSTMVESAGHARRRQSLAGHPGLANLEPGAFAGRTEPGDGQRTAGSLPGRRRIPGPQCRRHVRSGGPECDVHPVRCLAAVHSVHHGSRSHPSATGRSCQHAATPHWATIGSGGGSTSVPGMQSARFPRRWSCAKARRWPWPA